MDRHVRQLLAAEAIHLENERGARQASARCAKRFYLSSACVSHDNHGGLKRASVDFVHDRKTVRNMFIVVEPLRNSYDHLVTNTRGWLRNVVVFEDWDAPWAGDLWRLCQTDPAWSEEIVDLGIRWEGSHLKVAAKFKDSADVYNTIAVVLLQTWQFRAFSDSPWITLGSSRRTLLSSMLLCYRIPRGFLPQ